MPFKKMDVNENLRNISQQERDNIKLAVEKTWAKMRPDTTSLNYLYTMFTNNVDETFKGNCSRCKKRVITYWMTRLKSWGMR